MIDPIGGFKRILDFFVSYVETSFRISDPILERARRDLLTSINVLTTEPMIEPVLRYKESLTRLEDLLHEKALSPLSFEGRKAFVDLALSGLFPGEPADAGSPFLRKSLYAPYTHQVDMLGSGLRPGRPAIVTSGTGSGKTESFMLPIIAQIADEATTRWPQPPAGYLIHDWWKEKTGKFTPMRRGELRPSAVRALILYPMNALVADQMVRLRRTLDSEEARAAMETHFGANRIFFGQYNSETPVTGFARHPRRSQEKAEKERRQRQQKLLRATMVSMDDDQDAARRYDIKAEAEARAKKLPAPEATRFIFPSLDGGEMTSRWDMQEHAPDILVTNPSMLGAMLARQMEDPIFNQTRDWLETDENATFFLVFDELHLLRGSAGTETSFLIKSLLTRLSLDKPKYRHKLRVLASSASLPLDDARGERSLRYLRDLLAPFGTFTGPSDAGSIDPNFWRSCIIEGQPDLPSPLGAKIDGQSLADLLASAKSSGGFVASIDPAAAEHALSSVTQALGIPGQLPPAQRNAKIAEAAAERLAAACIDPVTGISRATSTSVLASRIFDKPSNADAMMRGLMLARALPETVVPCETLKKGTTSFRVHNFIRNIEGLFGSLSVAKPMFENLTIERGLSHAPSHVRGERGKRLFEMLYCEACGDLFVGGQRGRKSETGGRFELLPSNPELERIPDADAATSYDNMAFDEFAVFWPSATEPKPMEAGYDQWEIATLDVATGVIEPRGEATSGKLPGRIYFQTDAAIKKGERKTAQPFCCPKCGTDYSARPKHQRLSPVRAFRTGFNKASQLVATELFELLHADRVNGVRGGKASDEPKTLVFSDSRQDAANQALDVERLHMRDLKREILIEVGRTYLDDLKARYVAPDQRKQALADLMGDGEVDKAVELAAEWGSKALDVPNHKIQFEKLLNFESGGDGISRVVAEFVRLGLHPADDTGRRRFLKKPWYEAFKMEGDDVKFDDALNPIQKGEIRQEIDKSQYSLIIDAVFSNSFFALEETGLAYPSVQKGSSSDIDALDAWLRVFAGAYRIIEGQYFDENNVPKWEKAANVGPRNRVRRYAVGAFGQAGADAALTAVLQDFERLNHPTGGRISVAKLFLKVAIAGDPFWRCTACERVHLHRGAGKCTRCYASLDNAPTGAVEELWNSNFLGRRIVRGKDDGVPRFRLTCEELTGQTDDFADRLRRFKGIFVEDMSLIERAARDIDLLSVTTTMEVGIDIGSLHSVYQANMPPQRFNYQQRVGRAGRRGQAFSFVVTFCRGRTHDEHYFRNPAAITGDPPPPPFLAVDHLDIPMRLTRKVWLRAAFARLRDECGVTGESYPGDDLSPPDIHGEFVPTDVFYEIGSVWPDRLREALDSTIEDRDRFLDASVITGKPVGADAAAIRSRLGVDALMSDLFKVANGVVPPRTGLGQFLAEKGLLPMYGMPTRVRDLYLGIEREGGARFGAHDEYSWSKIDRDLDLAIAEFSPGRLLTKDKRKHLVVGFTGPLMDPQRRGKQVEVPDPLTPWISEEHHVGRCMTCGAASDSNGVPGGPTVCTDCGADIEPEVFRRFITPAGFRTDFQPKDGEEKYVRLALTTVATILREGNPTDHANVRVHRGAGITIMRLNEGPEDDQGHGEGFDITPMDDEEVHIPAAKDGRLINQGIVRDVLPGKGGRWKPVGDPDLGVGMISRKETDALYLEMLAFDPRLAVDLIAKRGEASMTASRAAAISATHILVQQAALELDVAPEEFEAIEPRRRGRSPVIQIADALVNGSGLCRALTSSTSFDPEPRIISMIREITTNEGDHPLKGLMKESHASACRTACYSCIQQYGNRRYHGLLDWRLGLSYLRTLIDPGYACGLDGRMADYPELRHWREHALDLANGIAAMRPSTLRLNPSVGDYELPSITDTSGGEGRESETMIIHPLWRIDQTAEIRFFGSAEPSRHRFINTFELARRPLKALDEAQKGLFLHQPV